MQTTFSARAGAEGAEKGAVPKPESWEETFPVANLGLKSRRLPLAAACTDSGSPSLPAPPSVFADLPRPCPAPPPEPTWRSAQVAVRWSVTPRTGSREGGADARGGDCAGGRGRSAEQRGGAGRAERLERGGSDMDRGEQGRRRLAPGGRGEPRSRVWATPTGSASVAEPREPLTSSEREEGPRRGSESVSECASACPSKCARLHASVRGGEGWREATEVLGCAQGGPLRQRHSGSALASGSSADPGSDGVQMGP